MIERTNKKNLCKNLFVYGTLKPECSNNYILQDIGGDFYKAILHGFQFDKKWEKETGYPGLIESDNSVKVEGYVFVSENLKNNWKIIDDFETAAYLRKRVSVNLDNNKKVTAFVYIINTNFDIKNF
jgi:gamma-glutamylcyclotransferase (GGCT)/AIG2-like uncharacterized protein YtfP